MEFGDRLGILRRKENMKQAETAALFGKSLNAYKSWELNISRPDYETVILIADHFKVTIDYLLGRTPESEPRLISEIETLLRPGDRGKYLDTMTNINAFIAAYPEFVSDFCKYLDISYRAYHQTTIYKPSESSVRRIKEDPQTIADMFSDNKDIIGIIDKAIDELRQKLYGLVTWRIIDTSLKE